MLMNIYGCYTSFSVNSLILYLLVNGMLTWCVLMCVNTCVHAHITLMYVRTHTTAYTSSTRLWSSCYFRHVMFEIRNY